MIFMWAGGEGGVGKTFASKWEVYWKVYHLCNGFFFFFPKIVFSLQFEYLA